MSSKKRLSSKDQPGGCREQTGQEVLGVQDALDHAVLRGVPASFAVLAGMAVFHAARHFLYSGSLDKSFLRTDVVWRAFDEVGIIVEQFADRLFELERAADEFRWVLDVSHFLLLWFSC
jgi:hypothetical protein